MDFFIFGEFFERGFAWGCDSGISEIQSHLELRYLTQPAAEKHEDEIVLEENPVLQKWHPQKVNDLGKLFSCLLVSA